LRIPTGAGGVEVEVQLLHERERLTQFITIVEKLEFKKFNIIISITRVLFVTIIMVSFFRKKKTIPTSVD
jgi:hypothetical protein